MPQRLTTPFLHRVLASPLGALMETRTFEAKKLAAMRGEFTIDRAGAAARAAVGGSLDDFIRELGATEEVPATMRPRLEDALAAYAAARSDYEEVARRWDEAFWDPSASATEGALVALEMERRLKGGRYATPGRIFGFLRYALFAPAVKFQVPAPAEVASTWAKEMANPDLLYRAPESMPTLELSRRVPGPSGVEYTVRFPSPSPFTRDTAYARVYEPDRGARALPTLIFGSGLGMVYDMVVYWPEEEYMGRLLSSAGCRVILPQSPWHGRRMPPGRYSGEQYLATAPVGLFQLYSAQAQETAVLVRWAREVGTTAVAVGGLSLGGIVAQQVAGRCGSWPESMRPDVVFLAATCHHLDQVLTAGELSSILRLDTAMAEAGWTGEQMERMRPLLDPPARPGIRPDRILAAMGRRDDIIPYQRSMELLAGWGVPETGILTWDTGHFGVMMRMLRTTQAQRLILRALHSAAGGGAASMP